MSHEGHALHRKSGPVERPPFSEAEAALIETFAARREEETLRMDDPYFLETRDGELLAKHSAEVVRLEQKFGEKNDDAKLAGAFEYAIARRLNGPSHWLGEHMRAQLTAPFDDYVNKVDLYIEDTREDSSRPVGLSVDVTFSQDGAGIAGKIRDLKYKLLDGGRLGQLSYYKPLGRAKDAPKTVWLPKVVVGIERARALDSLKNLAEAEENGAEEKSRDLKTELTLLYQMSEQLKAYLWYSQTRVSVKEKPHVSSAIARYEEALADIEGVLDSMNLDYGKLREFAETSVVTKVLARELAHELGYPPH